MALIQKMEKQRLADEGLFVCPVCGVKQHEHQGV